MCRPLHGPHSHGLRPCRADATSARPFAGGAAGLRLADGRALRAYGTRADRNARTATATFTHRPRDSSAVRVQPMPGSCRHREEPEPYRKASSASGASTRAIRFSDVLAVIETRQGRHGHGSLRRGVLTHILVQGGASVPIGTPIAVIGGEGSAGAAAQSPLLVADHPERTVAPPSAPLFKHEPRLPQHRPWFARQYGIDLATVSDGGPGGRIVRADINQAAHIGPRVPPRCAMIHRTRRSATIAAFCSSTRRAPGTATLLFLAAGTAPMTAVSRRPEQQNPG